MANVFVLITLSLLVHILQLLVYTWVILLNQAGQNHPAHIAEDVRHPHRHSVKDLQYVIEDVIFAAEAVAIPIRHVRFFIKILFSA